MRLESRELARGQVWASCDKRAAGRLVKVLGFNARYVYVRTIQLAPDKSRRALGRQYRILRSTFKPGSQGFSYVRESEDQNG